MTSRPSPESRVLGRVLSADTTPIAFEQSGAGAPLIVVSSALADRSDARRLARHLSPAFTVINYDVVAGVRAATSLHTPWRGRWRTSRRSSTTPVARRRCSAAPRARCSHWTPPNASATRYGDWCCSSHRSSSTTADLLWAGTTPGSSPPTSTLGARLRPWAFFMRRFLGMPCVAVALMHLLPMWRKLVRLAPTLAYDLALMHGTQSGAPLPANRWAHVSQRTLILAGEKSDPFLHRGGAALAEILPAAEFRTLRGTSHSAVAAAPKKLAGAVGEFLREP